VHLNKQTYNLFVFEGEKTEPQIFNSLRKYFLNEKENEQISISYCNNIYHLAKKIHENEYLEFFELLKEEGKIDDALNRDNIARIYLIFDYDGHANKQSSQKLQEMLTLFDNETEQGLLYISYPMGEALKHIKDSVNFRDTCAISEGKYKNLVSLNCDEIYKHPINYTKDIWKTLIIQHSKKANFIVNSKFEFPTDFIEQLTIFEHQKEKYIDQEEKVAVLSAFPLMLLDYYGFEKFSLLPSTKQLPYSTT